MPPPPAPPRPLTLEEREAAEKAILARLPEAEVRAVVARTGLPRCTPATIGDADALLAHLAAVRRQGFAVDDEENEPGIRCIGAAVTDHTGAVTGGVSVSGLAFELAADDAELAAAVAAAAGEVSVALGAPTAPTAPTAPAAV